jgi:hypothetical protein
MKVYYLILILIVASCNDKKANSIREIPCTNQFTYDNAGTLNGTYLTKYYAVEYENLDSSVMKTIRLAYDSVVKSVKLSNYSGFVCWFLKESEALKTIKNCEITDSHNISSDEHQPIVLFSYDVQKGTLQEIGFSSTGSAKFKYYRR